jgi:hypothetical protein
VEELHRSLSVDRNVRTLDITKTHSVLSSWVRSVSIKRATGTPVTHHNVCYLPTTVLGRGTCDDPMRSNFGFLRQFSLKQVTGREFRNQSTRTLESNSVMCLRRNSPVLHPARDDSVLCRALPVILQAQRPLIVLFDPSLWLSPRFPLRQDKIEALHGFPCMRAWGAVEMHGPLLRLASPILCGVLQASGTTHVLGDQSAGNYLLPWGPNGGPRVSVFTCIRRRATDLLSM